jgi:beta-lactamase regulating signal transducer with metallopeptidase domain/thiol-disulfide isomerase/thioredoxin
MTSESLTTDGLGGMAIRSCLLLLLTAVTAFVCRRRSASVVHGIWAAGLGGCLAIPLVMLLSPSWSLPLLPPEKSAELTTPASVGIRHTASHPGFAPHMPIDHGEATQRRPSTTHLATEPAIKPFTTPDQVGQTTVQPSATVTSQFQWPPLAALATLIWATGVSTLLMRLLHQTMAVRRRVDQASDLFDDDWNDQRDAVAKQVGVRVNVALKRHPEALSPMVIGLLQPVVLLPGDSDTWPEERRRQVLLHELAHIGRRDVSTQTMAAIACAVYWFNPLAWFGASQMKRLREIACDDMVVIHSKVPANYAQTLLDVAKAYRCQPPTSAVAMARSSHVEGRIQAILSSTRNRALLTRRSVRYLAAAALVVAAFVGTCHFSSRATESTEKETDQAVAADPQEPRESRESEAIEDSESRTMEVRVLDANGGPLAGASVYANILPMQRQRSKEFPNRTYTTDERGRAEIEIPRRLRIMRLWPSREGYVPLFVGFEEGQHEEGRLLPDQYEFRLQKGRQLSGRVVDEEGNPVSNAKVQVSVSVDEPPRGAHPTPVINTWLAYGDKAAVTNQDGHWEINNAPAPPEQGKDYEFRLQVTHLEFAGDTNWGGLQRQQGITTAALRSGDATLILNPGLTFSGQVTGPDGEPVTKGLVVWNDDPYLAVGDNETPIDEEGRYKTKPLAPGMYPITVLAPGFAPWQRSVELRHDLGDLDIQLESGHRLQIQFVDQQGDPIPNAYVGIGQWRGTSAIFNQNHSNVPDSRIPRSANDEGLYEWNWAPDDGVQYRVGASGYESQEIALVAKSTPHVITLNAQRVVVGTVTDTSTGKPIEKFQVMPVIVFRPDFYSTFATGSKVGRDGRYELRLTGSADLTKHYRVRFEAEGYRSVVSEESFGPLDGRATLDIALQPASSRGGRVVDAKGAPVENATVLAASPTEVPTISNGRPDAWDSRPIPTGANGNFRLSATTEPVLVRVYHDRGFAEHALAPDDEEVGVLKLQPWATVSGRLVQDGQPMAGQSIFFHPLVRRGLTEARFQDSYSTQTDTNGHFQFERLPPTSGSLKAYLGPWEDSPLTSSESIPLDLSPGEHREVTLGGDGATITGRVVATGRSNDDLSKQWSLNYLVSRDRGIKYPLEPNSLGFQPSGPFQADWLRQPDFQYRVARRLNFFVKLSGDGQLTVHGVKPGEYDLVIQLYEQPAGCLIETIGEKVVPITVTARQAASGQAEIGDVKVECRIGPRVGSDMRAFQFVDARGRVRNVQDMQGQYVLLHVWATWCAPCLQSMPRLKGAVAEYSDSPLTVVGLNVDEDAAQAKAMSETQDLNWAQNYLGANSDRMRQLAVSSVPAYYLIGPDGTLVGSANEWEVIEKLLGTELR